MFLIPWQRQFRVQVPGFGDYFRNTEMGKFEVH